ncbi:hypothetical protein ABW636_06180 [Aquimarina sp. 2201CG1-2-11]|uniref:hypothetical protein n=1 Tax=Aquimarina discodermiae TaxID=3231043 RepID=UPI003461A98A
MKERNQINLDYTLIRYFSNKTTFKEEAFVEQWISESIDNIYYYQRLQRLWIQRITL